MSGCEIYEKGGGVVLLFIAIKRIQSFHNKNLSYEIREIMFWRLNDSEESIPLTMDVVATYNIYKTVDEKFVTIYFLRIIFHLR